jgi:hypothetical protein
MPDYGQFCPLAQAAEVLTERWTPLVIREIALTGSRRFNDIQRGVPLMSSSLLTKVRGTVKTDALPAKRTVIHFRFRHAIEKLRYFWLVFPEADLCLTDPGFGVDVTVSSDPLFASVEHPASRPRVTA